MVAKSVIFAFVNIPLLSLHTVFLQLSHSWTLPIGSLVVPIREMLSEPELVLDQWFHLDGASPESQLLLRAELKVQGLFIHCCGTFCLCLFARVHISFRGLSHSLCISPVSTVDVDS